MTEPRWIKRCLFLPLLLWPAAFFCMKPFPNAESRCLPLRLSSKWRRWAREARLRGELSELLLKSAVPSLFPQFFWFLCDWKKKQWMSRKRGFAPVFCCSLVGIYVLLYSFHGWFLILKFQSKWLWNWNNSLLVMVPHLFCWENSRLRISNHVLLLFLLEGKTFKKHLQAPCELSTNGDRIWLTM